MNNVKLCVDCANYGTVGMDTDTCKCMLNINTDLVNGSVQPKLSPYELRETSKLCGKSGKWWRPKDEKPKGRGIILNRKKK